MDGVELKLREDANEVMRAYAENQSSLQSRQERDADLQEQLARAKREKRVARLTRLWASLKARCGGS
jgi:predicted  nucleic acid-binding Zn-ribbon protein